MLIVFFQFFSPSMLIVVVMAWAGDVGNKAAANRNSPVTMMTIFLSTVSLLFPFF